MLSKGSIGGEEVSYCEVAPKLETVVSTGRSDGVFRYCKDGMGEIEMNHCKIVLVSGSLLFLKEISKHLMLLWEGRLVCKVWTSL